MLARVGGRLSRFGVRSLVRFRESPLLQVLGVRALTFPVSLVSGLLWIRLVISHLGPADYAFVALVVGLQFLLGFLDFGTGAHVLEAAGRYRVIRDVAALGRALGAAWRAILAGNLVLLLGAIAVFAAGQWGVILGFPEQSRTAGLAVVLMLVVNALVRPLSLSTGLVAGLGRAAVATWAQALTGVASLGFVALLLSLHAPIAFVAVTPLAGQLVAYLLPLVVSLRLVPGLPAATLRGMRPRARTGERLRRLAVPMLLIQAIGPLNDQLDRLVLSHLSTVEALAVYSLGAQLVSSAESFITVLTAPLWAEYAALRAQGGTQLAVRRALTYLRRLWPIAILFGTTFCVLARLVSPLLSDGQLVLPWGFCVVLGAALPMSATAVLLGIGLTDARSLRMQPVILAFTTAINLGLTFVLAPPLGAVGPALASLLAALVHIPLLGVLAWRRLHRDPPGPDGPVIPAVGSAASGPLTSQGIP